MHPSGAPSLFRIRAQRGTSWDTTAMSTDERTRSLELNGLSATRTGLQPELKEQACACDDPLEAVRDAARELGEEAELKPPATTSPKPVASPAPTKPGRPKRGSPPPEDEERDPTDEMRGIALEGREDGSVGAYRPHDLAPAHPAVDTGPGLHALLRPGGLHSDRHVACALLTLPTDRAVALPAPDSRDGLGGALPDRRRGYLVIGCVLPLVSACTIG